MAKDAELVFQIFKEFDTGNQCLIRRSELDHVLSKLAPAAASKHSALKRILDEMEDSQTKRINYVKFLNWVFDTAPWKKKFRNAGRLAINRERMTRTKEESLLLGVSVEFITTEFLSEIERHFGNGVDPNYYQINKAMLCSPKARGYEVICPRDHQPGCSYADAIESVYTGPATVMLSWTWQYTARTVATALARWCARTERDPAKTFVWQCALCNNQFRVEAKKARNENEEFSVFRRVFEGRVRSTGHILALLSPWQKPLYVSRIWCVFELWAACSSAKCELEVIMSEEAEHAFHDALSSDGMTKVWKVFGSIKIQEAEASFQADRDNILRLVDPDVHTEEDYQHSQKVKRLNQKVVERLQHWFADISASYIDRCLQNRQAVSARAGANTAWLLTEVADWSRAWRLLEACRADLKATGKTGSLDDAWLLKSMGAWQTDNGDYDEGMRLYRLAKVAMEACDASGSLDYARLLRTMAKNSMVQYKFSDAMELFGQAQAAFEAANATKTPNYAVFLRSKAECHEKRGEIDQAIYTYEKAKNTFEVTDSCHTPNYAGVLMGMGKCMLAQEQASAAMPLFVDAERAFHLTGSHLTSHYADLLEAMAECHQILGDHKRCLKSFLKSKSVFEDAGACKTIEYARLRAKIGDFLQQQGESHEAWEHYDTAQQILQAAGATALSPKFSQSMTLVRTSSDTSCPPVPEPDFCGMTITDGLLRNATIDLRSVTRDKSS